MKWPGTLNWLEKGTVALAILNVGIAALTGTRFWPTFVTGLAWGIITGWVIIASRWRRMYVELQQRVEKQSEVWADTVVNLVQATRCSMHFLQRENRRLAEELYGIEPWKNRDEPWLRREEPEPPE